MKKAFYIFLFYLLTSFVLFFLFFLFYGTDITNIPPLELDFGVLATASGFAAYLSLFATVPFILSALSAALSYLIFKRIQTFVLFVSSCAVFMLSMLGLSSLNASPYIVFIVTYGAMLVAISCLVSWCAKRIFDDDKDGPRLQIAGFSTGAVSFVFLALIAFIGSLILYSGYVTLFASLLDGRFRPDTFLQNLQDKVPFFYVTQMLICDVLALIAVILSAKGGLSMARMSKITIPLAFLFIAMVEIGGQLSMGADITQMPFGFAVLLNNFITPTCFLSLAVAFAFWLTTKIQKNPA